MAYTLSEIIDSGSEKYGESDHLVDSFSSGRRVTSYRKTADLVHRGATLIQQALGKSTAPRHVGILAENSSLWLIAYYSTVYAGATIVPLDIKQSEEDIKAVIRDAGLSLIFVSPTFSAFGKRLIEEQLVSTLEVLDEGLWNKLEKTSPLPKSPAKAEDVAAIIYTSGTTGLPKGVVLTHRALTNQALQNREPTGFNGDARLIEILPLNHVFVFVAALTCMAAGSVGVFIDSQKPSAVIEALKSERITHLAGIPLLYEAFLKGILAKAAARGKVAEKVFQLLLKVSWEFAQSGNLTISRKIFRSVHRQLAPYSKVFVCGGAKSRPETVQAFLAMGYNFLEGYGLTETSGGIIANSFHGKKVVGSAGRAFGDTEVKIANPSPEGEGEICIRGQSLFSGYFKKPEATAEVMEAQGWFHTGDLGRLDGDANLWITGRAKELIVLASGKKVAPEELEFHFSKSPLVDEVGVIGKSDGATETIQLIAVPAAAARADLVLENLNQLAAELAPYKRPHGIWFHHGPLPRTSTRKIRRRELSTWLKEAEKGAGNTPAQQLSAVDRQVMQSNEMNIILRACSEHLRRDLAVENASPTTSLTLDLGIDSLLLLEIATSIEHLAGVQLENKKLAGAQTLGDLYDLLRGSQHRERQKEKNWQELLAKGPVNVTAASPFARLAELVEKIDFAIIQGIARNVYHLKGHNVSAVPTHGPYILAPNHVSYFDYPLIMSTLPESIRKNVFTIGKAELTRFALGRFFGSVHHLIPVDRTGDVLPALQGGAQVLREGKILFLHPEGTRSASGKLQPFKRGVTILAETLKIPVVPVYIRGAYEIYPRKARFPRLFDFKNGRRLEVDVFFGAPIPGDAPDLIERMTRFMKETAVENR